MTSLEAANLSVLAARNPGLADGLRNRQAPEWLSLERARSGDWTAIVRQDGEETVLHSRYDPIKEARRLAESVSPGATVIVEGFGLGYHVEALLEHRQPFRVLIIDHDVALLAAATRSRDLTTLFADGRVIFAPDPDEQELHYLLGRAFQPLFSSNLESLALAPWRRLRTAWFDGRREWLREAADAILNDVAAQGRFGLRWTRNSLVNLATSAAPLVLLGTAGALATGALATEERPRALITAAGPSLKAGLDDSDPGSWSILATDTSRSSLEHHGTTPREVLSIDCQLISYHHFFEPTSSSTRGLFELASAPSVLRRSPKHAFVLGEHPLHAYLAVRLPGLLRLDTKGGNVTYAALDYLRKSGYREIEIVGADYAYPKLQSYTNPSFLHAYLGCRAERVSPLESLLSAFALDRLPEGASTTPILQGYRESLESYVREAGGAVEDRGGGRLRIDLPGRADLRPRLPGEDEAEIQRTRITEILRDYQDALSALDVEEACREIRAGEDTSRDSLEVLITIMPIAQALMARRRGIAASEALEVARSSTVSLLRRLSL